MGAGSPEGPGERGGQSCRRKGPPVSACHPGRGVGGRQGGGDAGQLTGAQVTEGALSHRRANYGRVSSEGVEASQIYVQDGCFGWSVDNTGEQQETIVAGQAGRAGGRRKVIDGCGMERARSRQDLDAGGEGREESEGPGDSKEPTAKYSPSWSLGSPEATKKHITQRRVCQVPGEGVPLRHTG